MFLAQSRSRLESESHAFHLIIKKPGECMADRHFFDVHVIIADFVN